MMERRGKDDILNDRNFYSPSTNTTSLRILHISDIHIENISITPEQLFTNLKDRPIDLIALTGDFLDRKRSIPKLVPYLEALNKLNPVMGPMFFSAIMIMFYAIQILIS